MGCGCSKKNNSKVDCSPCVSGEPIAQEPSACEEQLLLMKDQRWSVRTILFNFFCVFNQFRCNFIQKIQELIDATSPNLLKILQNSNLSGIDGKFLIDVTGSPANPVVSLVQGVRKYTSSPVGDGTETEFTVSHSLGTNYVSVKVIEISTGIISDPAQVEVVTANSSKITISPAPASSDVRIIIFG